jgi:hypothetical protein
MMARSVVPIEGRQAVRSTAQTKMALASEEACDCSSWGDGQRRTRYVRG